MLRKYIIPAILALSVNCYRAPQQTYTPPSVSESDFMKPKAVLYWDAYADEEYREPTKECQKWESCLENLVNGVEKDIVPQIRQSKRFQKYYSDLDFKMKGVKPWESFNYWLNPLDLLKPGVMFALTSLNLNDFLSKHKMKGTEVDIRLIYSGERPLLHGLAKDIPGKYAIIYDTKYKKDVTRHEVGHLFGLHHNSEKNDTMHPYEYFENSKFSKEARGIMADRVVSILKARELEKRIKLYEPVFNAAERYLDDESRLEVEFSEDKDMKCIVEKRNMGESDTVVAINPSGSLSVEYGFYSKKKKPYLKKRMHEFYTYLKTLGIRQDNEDLIYYSTEWNNMENVVINVDKNVFEKNFSSIVNYLFHHSFLNAKKMDALKAVSRESLATSVDLYDFLYYLSKREKIK